VRQSTRRDSPIEPDDVIPSLLVEDVETVRLMVSTMAEETRAKAAKQARALIENAAREGYSVPDAEEKLRVFDEGSA
jgi:hypothetical protein